MRPREKKQLLISQWNFNVKNINCIWTDCYRGFWSKLRWEIIRDTWKLTTCDHLSSKKRNTINNTPVPPSLAEDFFSEKTTKRWNRLNFIHYFRGGFGYLQSLFPHIRSSRSEKKTQGFAHVWFKTRPSFCLMLLHLVFFKKIDLPRKWPYGTGSTIVVRALSPRWIEVIFQMSLQSIASFPYLVHHEYLKHR